MMKSCQNDQRRSRVWKLLRRVNSADLLLVWEQLKGRHECEPATLSS